MRLAHVALALGLVLPGLSFAQSAGDGSDNLVRPRVVRPPAVEPPAADTEAAANPAVEQVEEDGKTIWQRARERRFKRAPRYRGEMETGAEPVRESPAIPIPAIDTELMGGAVLRQLDKMTGKTRTFEMKVGELRQVDRLRVVMAACRAPDDESSRGTMAFLKIWDIKNQDAPAVFSGWMFADSPALSGLDHPRYDLWVINCTTSAPDTSAASE